MKKMLIGVGMLAAMTLSCLVAVAGNNEDKAGVLTVMDVSFLTYCDGAHFIINKSNGTVTGYQTGCVSASLMGIKSVIPRQGNQTAIVYHIDDSGWRYICVVRWDKTWAYYNYDGSIANSGTWASGVPAKAKGDGAKTSAGN